MTEEVSIAMSIGEIAGLVVSICSIFVGLLMYMQKSRNALLEDNLKTMWERIDQNKDSIDELNKNLDKNYHDKNEIERYIQLINAPILQQMEHINEKLDDVHRLTKHLVRKKDGGA